MPLYKNKQLKEIYIQTEDDMKLLACAPTHASRRKTPQGNKYRRRDRQGKEGAGVREAAAYMEKSNALQGSGSK
jgi:hypothetical protein